MSDLATSPILMKTPPSIRINLAGVDRTMVLDFNALDLIEDLTGKRIMGGQFKEMTAKDIISFFYACLAHEDPNLTPEKVGESLLPGHYPEAVDIIVRLLLADTDPKVLAPFVRTGPAVIEAALTLAKVSAGDTLFDLGCGTGEVLVAAAKRGAKVIGVEMDPERVLLSKAALVGANLEGEVLGQPIQDTGLKSASVVFVYLLSTSNTKIRPLLMRDLKPGARIVSHDFAFQGWKAEEVLEVEEDGRPHQVYLYIHGSQMAEAVN